MKPLDIFVGLGFLFALGMLIYIAYIATTEGVKCEFNPLVYGADKLSEANGAEFIGTGYFLKQGSPQVSFDRYNISVSFELADTNRKKIDWDKLKNFSFKN